MKTFSSNTTYLVLLCTAFSIGISAQTAAPGLTTAWHNGRFQVDVAAVLGRSSIVLGQPNVKPDQAMPLGNGRLGVAVWSANGLTAQLNRADTLPYRLSPGQVVIPGLSSLTQAKDYAGRLNLYDGEFQEHGGGMAATAYVQPGTDTLVIDVTGAKADEPQTAQLKLWTPRTTKAEAKGKVGLLSQGWIDDLDPGASGRPFGALSAITADGRDVFVAVTDPLTVTVTFKPDADGHFRVLVASPHYDGKQDALTIARPALSAGTAAAHKSWWHAYWNRLAVLRITSKDGSGEYMENLRNIYLFAAAAEKGDEYPGTQAGVADMLSSGRDFHQWDSAAFWHWNIRMQVAANLGAGVPELNAPYFNLYRENLENIENWTRAHLNGRAGACIPETMRFNGQGIEYESGWDTITGNIYARDCDATFPPFFNARTLSTGAEVSLWVWQQYLANGDLKFLAVNYPVMASAARFLLSYQKPGPDGLLHMSPSNAHETQWDVTDPTTDIAAAMALYPVTIQAAKLLGKDPDLVEKLQAALPKIPPFPRTQLTPPLTLLPSSADADGADMIAESYLPGATNHNGENIGLEPIWPYDLIGDDSPLFGVAKRTYEHRISKGGGGWSFDSIVAARLEMGSEVGAALLRSVENSARAVNGLELLAPAGSGIRDQEFYVEETGVVADALQEALVQDYDGLIRIAPAIPPGWDFDGSVYVRGKTRVDVQVREGISTTVVLEPGITQTLKLRNPWPGRAIDVISGKAGTKIVDSAAGPVIAFKAIAGENYLVERHGEPTSIRLFESIGGAPATAAKKLGPVQLGLFSSGRVSVTTISADNPIARQYGWLKECEDRVAAAQGKPVDILFIGDSITQNFVEEPKENWKLVGAAVWKKHYGDKHALNFGVGADGTEHILWRMDHENIWNLAPKVIVLLAGVNDMRYSPEDIAAGTKAVIDKSRAMYPASKIVLMAILPNGRDPAKTAAANQITKTFADNQNVFYLDLGPSMPPEGNGFKGVGEDHIHLTSEGYEIWASNLDPLFDKLLTP
jgi:lysophospholipase L1-like esterase